MNNEQLLKSISVMMSELIDRKLEPVNNQLAEIGVRLKDIEVRLANVEARLDDMKVRLDNMEIRLYKVEADVAFIRIEQVQMKKDIKIVGIRIEEVYVLALDAWGQSTENRKLLEDGRMADNCF